MTKRMLITVMVATFLAAGYLASRPVGKHLRHGDEVLTVIQQRRLAEGAVAYAKTHRIGFAQAYRDMLRDEAYLRSLQLVGPGLEPIDGWGRPMRVWRSTDSLLAIWSAGENGRFEAGEPDDVIWLVTPQQSSVASVEEIERAMPSGQRDAAAATMPSDPATQPTTRAEQ